MRIEEDEYDQYFCTSSLKRRTMKGCDRAYLCARSNIEIQLVRVIIRPLPAESIDGARKCSILFG